MAADLHRYFFAFLPPDQMARQMVQEAVRLDPGAQHQRADRVHSTIGITDDFPSPRPEVAAALLAVGQGIAADPFICQFDRIMARPGYMALRLSRRSRPMGDLFRQIESGMRRKGCKLREGYAHDPHITLSYRGGLSCNRLVPGYRWLVEDLVLIHSHVGETRHDILGRWSLSGAEGPQLSLF
ncbi:hypothetical protein ACFB49_31830 [Sphingomonas sp. DBB INV C78]|uniref:2'-5' RNA ligase family protein n=1 Tax=Sphingomonas sp. DBB INV C78 TaxID=3349434 RepID=UPI0036D23FEA